MRDEKSQSWKEEVKAGDKWLNLLFLFADGDQKPVLFFDPPGQTLTSHPDEREDTDEFIEKDEDKCEVNCYMKK